MYRLIALSCIALLAACGDDERVLPPKLSNVTVTTAEDTAANVVVPLTAANASAVTLSVVTSPAHGTLTGSGPTWTYTPAANYNGADTAVVKAQDSHGSSTATVALTITAVNDAPVAVADSFAAAFETPLVIPAAMLLANDSDVDGTALTVTAVTALADGHGSADKAGTSVTFTPEHGFQGAAKFMYTVSDGTLTAQAMVTVSIGADAAPVATDDAISTDEDVTATIPDTMLLANDTDPEHQTLMISAVGNAAHGTVTHIGTQVSFVPDAEFSGTASFDYTVTDGLLTDSGTVTLTVNAVDDPPVAVDDVALVAEGVVATAFDLLANDTDIDGGPKAIASVTQPGHGTAAVVGGISVTYASATGYCNDTPNTARDTFTYTLMPGGSTATVTVKVTCACGLKKSTDFVVGSN